MAYPDTQPKVFASQFAQIATLTSTGLGLAFGFNANYLDINNDGPVRIFVKFGTTSPASTSDFALTVGQRSVGIVSYTAGIGLTTTTTSTGPSDQPQVRVAAIGA